MWLRDAFLTYTAVVPDDTERRTAMFKDNKLRLLMTLVGFERLGLEDEIGASWIIPSDITAEELHHTVAVIRGHREKPIFQYGDEDPIPVEEMLRRKPTIRPRATYDDDDGLASSGDDFVVPTLVGPTTKKDALAELKKKRRRRRKSSASDDDDEGGISDTTREARKNARMARDREKYLKVKSTDFVRASDDETDEEADREFFRREEERRKGQAGKILETMRAGIVDGKKRKRGNDSEKLQKRRRSPSLDVSKSLDSHVQVESSDEDFFARPKGRKSNSQDDRPSPPSESDENVEDILKRSASGKKVPYTNTSSEDEATYTPISSQQGSQETGKDQGPDSMDAEDTSTSDQPNNRRHTLEVEEDSDDVSAPLAKTGRRREKVAIVESDNDSF